MKQQFFLLLLVAAMLFGCAGAPKAPRDARSENFEVTSSYLDLGGQVYAYMDVEGDVEAAAELVNELVAVIDEIPPKYKARVDAVRIAKSLGMTDVQAIGMSSYKVGDRYINKSFTKTVYPRTGLMQYFGGDPHPFEILSLAPADAIMAYEADVNLQAFLDTLYLVLQDVGDADIVADVNRHLDTPIVPGALTYRQLMNQLDTKMMGSISFHPTQTMTLPDTDIVVPVVEAFFAIDNMGPLMDILVMKAKELPIFSVWEDAEWQRVGVAEYLTEELLDYRPVIWRHKATQRLYIATSAEFLEARLQQKGGLSTSAVFQEISASLPLSQGNSIIYVSPEVYSKIIGSVDAALAKEPKLMSVRKVIGVLASKVSPGQVWMSQNTPDGIYQISSSSFSHKITLMGSMYMSQLYAVSMLGFAGEFLFDEALRGLLLGMQSPLPAEPPSYQPDLPDVPQMTPEEEELQKKLEKENGSEAPGSDEEVPEYVEEFMKKWKERHPGDEI